MRTESPGLPKSVPDRIARQLLRLEGTDPRALMPIKGSLLISGIRCMLSYVVLPVLAPLIGLSGWVGRPISIVLTVAAIVLATVSLRRVWAADWKYRWYYTVFSAVVLTLLFIVIVVDVRGLMA
ncbi:MAG: hypothetical protein WD178_07320 [Actinomycetota bacterium]